jgi:hypothetical protein
MAEKIPPDKTSALGEVTRRSLFQVAARVGAGLVAFVPAAAILWQDVPVVQAATQDIPVAQAAAEGCCCTGYRCYNSVDHRWEVLQNCNGTLVCSGYCQPPSC